VIGIAPICHSVAASSAKPTVCAAAAQVIFLRASIAVSCVRCLIRVSEMPPKKNVLGKRAKGSNGVRATSVPNGLDAASSAAASKKRAPSRGHSAKRVPTVAISLDEALEASKLQAVAAAASQVASAPESVLHSACQLSSQAHTICRRRRREAGRLRRISAAPTCHLAEAHFGGLKDGHTKVLRCGGAGIAARCCRRERTLRDVSYLRFSTAPLMAAETRDCCVSDEPTMDPCLTSKKGGNWDMAPVR